MEIKQNSLEMLVQSYNELMQISCKGNDTVRMCKALTWLQASYQDLKEVYDAQKKEVE